MNASAAFVPLTADRARVMGRILFLVASLCLAYGFEPYGRAVFMLLTFFLLVYIGFEILMERSTGVKRIFADPCALSSIVTFGIFFGISNFAFFGTADYEFGDSFQDVNNTWMNRAMLLVCVSAAAMWVGYDSTAGKCFSEQVRNNRFLKGFLRKTYCLRWPVIWICLLVSLVSRFIQISLGIFGYSSEIEQLYALAPYRQYLDIGASLGRVGLVGVSLAYFSGERKSRWTKYALAMFFLYEIFFGFLSGMKLQAVAALIIVGVCRYAITGKIPVWSIVASAIILYFAYTVIEPYRIIRLSDEDFRTRDIVATGSVMLDIAIDPEKYSSMETSHLRSFVLRSGQTLEAARSIRFKEESGLPEDAPEFLRNILISPALAFVPRLAWREKPFGDLGIWYARVVNHSPVDLTSHAMSPVGYLYFAGGSIAVLAAFFVIGLLLRVSCTSFRNMGGGGMFVFLGMLGMFFWIDSDVAGIFTSAFRFLPLLIVSQRFLFES
jgi:hypothetical protein